MYTYGTKSVGYGMGMRTPRQNPKRTEFCWDGAAGAFASVDPVNQITIYYAQHVLLSHNKSLRAWLYNAVRAELHGEIVHIPDIELNYDPSIIY